MSVVDTVIKLEDILVQNENIPTVDLDGEVGMVNINTGKYYGLDAVGSYIWGLLETPKSPAEVISILLREYNVDEESCREQVLFFLNSLYIQNLLRIKE